MMPMRRRTLFLVSIVIAACGKSGKPIDSVFPPRLTGGWTRGEVTSPASEIPQAVTDLGVAETAETRYMGPATVRVRVFRMKAEASAFEMIQKWRQSDGLAAYQGPYFFVVSPSSEASPVVVGELLRNLQRYQTEDRHQGQ
jgi:hypothetical protein